MSKNKWFVAFPLLPILLFLVIACGSEATATPPPAATANDDDDGIKAKDLIGFYWGVNPVGGLNGLSISDNDGDGELLISVGATFFDCLEPGETGIGRFEGTGTITEEGFVTTGLFTCLNEDGGVREIPLNSVPFKFSRDDNLIINLDNGVILHHVSKR